MLNTKLELGLKRVNKKINIWRQKLIAVIAYNHCIQNIYILIFMTKNEVVFKEEGIRG